MAIIINGTTGISDVDGSASVPAYSGTDSNTGMFFPAADTIAFAEGGVESMRLNSVGNLGIGTNNPQFRLHSFGVAGSTVAGLFQTNQPDAYITFRSSTTSSDTSCRMGAIGENLVFLNNGANERMRIDSSGNVGIGTSSPVSIGTGYGTVDVRGSNGGGYRWGSTANNAYTFCDSNGLVMATASSLPLILQTNNTERMRIDTAGRVTIPNQPTFTVRKNNGTNSTAAGVIVFNAVSTNTGSHYNNTNGRFTAPIAGRYLFVFAGSSQITSDFGLLINGSVTNYQGYASGANTASTATAIFNLNANDYVQVEAVASYRGDNHAMWCGCLIN